MKPDFSLILACYNEGPTLLKSLNKIIKVFKDIKYTWEIIAIDDASKDSTYKTLKKFASETKNIKVYKHSKNVGRGGTVIEGIKKSKANIVGFIDVDLEVSPVYIPEFIRAIKDGSDVVAGLRVYNVNFFSLHRWVLSKGYMLLVKAILNLNVYDTEVGYKFFNRKKILPVIKEVKDKKWFFDTEIIAISLHKKLKVTEIPVLFLRRSDKKSTVHIFRDTVIYLKTLLKFKQRFSNPK